AHRGRALLRALAGAAARADREPREAGLTASPPGPRCAMLRASMETPSAPRPLRPDDGRLLRGRRSRAQIRAAARALFREKGFDGATLRAIAARGGVAAG